MKFISSITLLPLRDYITASVDGLLEVLLTEGEYSEDAAKEAWEVLMEQVADVAGGNNRDESFTLLKQIHTLTANYNMVMLLVDVLEEIGFVERYVNEVNAILNTTLEFNVYDKEAYNKDLQRCRSLAKAIKLKVELKTAAYEASVKNSDKDFKKPTREDFAKLLINISNFAGYQLPDTISTFEFYTRIKQLSEHIDKKQTA